MKKTLTKFKTSKTKKEISNLISEILSTLEKKVFLMMNFIQSQNQECFYAEVIQ